MPKSNGWKFGKELTPSVSMIYPSLLELDGSISKQLFVISTNSQRDVFHLQQGLASGVVDLVLLAHVAGVQLQYFDSLSSSAVALFSLNLT